VKISFGQNYVNKTLINVSLDCIMIGEPHKECLSHPGHTVQARSMPNSPISIPHPACLYSCVHLHWSSLHQKKTC